MTTILDAGDWYKVEVDNQGYFSLSFQENPLIHFHDFLIGRMASENFSDEVKKEYEYMLDYVNELLNE
ncbi:MAG: hypothetical protein KA318_00105 [Nitrosomonas sp.]|nr:hypothetical protein [Nitrosomonas sp.]